jgi:hypothetical protein
MAGETAETTDDDADSLGMSDSARIALRRDFEHGAAFHREATLSSLGNASDPMSTAPSRRGASGAASLLDAILYDDVSPPIHASLDRAHLQSRDLCSEADDR